MRVVVYGAYGHTGRFVVRALRERGVRPVLAGRDGGRLARLDGGPDAERAVADLGSPHALDALLDGADAVVNCAGPFATTADPLIAAALRTGTPYLDIAAEPDVV
jgi:short subunit dehydrogenase-like uncharacterized protein